MFSRFFLMAGIVASSTLVLQSEVQITVYSAKENRLMTTPLVQKSDAEWQKDLTPEQFKVMRKKGTERAFTGEYVNNHASGVYHCSACKLDVFSSETKFESGTGWPSFWAPINQANVTTRPDNSLFSHRTEVICPRCGSHLGHVFNDGPAPSHLRYCINSIALKFTPSENSK